MANQLFKLSAQAGPDYDPSALSADDFPDADTDGTEECPVQDPIATSTQDPIATSTPGADINLQKIQIVMSATAWVFKQISDQSGVTVAANTVQVLNLAKDAAVILGNLPKVFQGGADAWDVYRGQVVPRLTQMNQGPAVLAARNALQAGATAINGATRTVPLGFESEAQFLQASQELQGALQESGINDAIVGVRGSSVTGFSPIKGTTFNPGSDIDFFVESKELTDAYTFSNSIKGFVNPNKILPDFPALQQWASKWSSILGREVTPGGFALGSLPKEPAIVVK